MNFLPLKEKIKKDLFYAELKLKIQCFRYEKYQATSNAETIQRQLLFDNLDIIHRVHRFSLLFISVLLVKNK